MKKTFNERENVKEKYEGDYRTGYEKGYEIGRQKGISSYAQPFPGISIIIPTRNNAELLRKCLENMIAHTPEPYEIIVIDKGSSDGTERAASKLSDRVRYRRLEQDPGFAAGMNQGLRMARGESLVLLSENAVVSAHWLSNLLSCRQAYNSACLVGPVTDAEIGGQQIGRPHEDGLEIPRTEESFNGANPGLWRETECLSFFCMLMNRSVFRKLGYLDEGFVNQQDAEYDYCLRARLLGMPLVVAGDTLIRLNGNGGVNGPDEKNPSDGGGKWGDPGEAEAYVKLLAEKPSAANDCYPTHVLVKGVGETRYWLEDGFRHPVINGEELEAVRLSQIELTNWHIGPSLDKDDALHKLATLSSVPSPYGFIAEGILVRDERGALYQSCKGKLRGLIGRGSREAWRLANRPVYAVSDDVLAQYPAGMPVMPPPAIRSSNL